jgi:chromosome segregation ATPase
LDDSQLQAETKSTQLLSELTQQMQLT